MQSFSASAAAICLAQKTWQRMTSENDPVCSLSTPELQNEKKIPARGILKALSYLKSMCLQPFVSGITLHKTGISG
jgi:hypothetical protein